MVLWHLPSAGWLWRLKALADARRRGLLTALAVATAVAFCAAAFWQYYPPELLFGQEVEVSVPVTAKTLRHSKGLAFAVRIDQLGLAGRNSKNDVSPALRITLLENGVPLGRAPLHVRIETSPGLFDHWGDDIFLSTLSGSKPEAATEYSVRYLDCTGLVAWLPSFNSTVFLWLAVVLAVALGAASACWRDVASRRVAIILLMGLAGSVAPALASSWDEVIVSNDSLSYVADLWRPPLYPAFIQVFQGDPITEADLSAGAFNQPHPAPPQSLLNVIRAQKVLLWAAFLVAAAAVSGVVSPPLTALLFFCLAYFHWHAPDSLSLLMSEPLAGVWLYLLVAGFFLLARRPSPWLLPLLALAFACLVLTRSAGVFGVVFLLGGVALATVHNWRRKRALAAALALVALIGGVSVATLLLCNFHSSGCLALSPLKNFERIAFALAVAGDDDGQYLPDDDCRRFFESALAHKRLREQAWLQAGRRLERLNLNLNCWQAACPAAEAVAEEQGLPRGRERSSFVDGLFGRTADVLLRRHASAYWEIVCCSFFEKAAGASTRLHFLGLSFLQLMVVAFGCCLLGLNRRALAGATCLLAHLASLLVVCMHEEVLPRYVRFSEWTCVLGFYLAGAAVLPRMSRSARWLFVKISRTPQLASASQDAEEQAHERRQAA